MSLKKTHISIIAIFVLGFASLFIGLFISQHNLLNKNKRIRSDFHGTYLAKARTIPSFSLEGTDNTLFDNTSLQGHWTFMFFGFTNCGYLCPTTMAELGKMYALLEKKKVKELPQVVMVSIDPDRDTLEKLKHYVQAFNPHFSGALGKENTINAMTHEFGIAYEKVMKQGKPDDNYEVQHSGAILLFNPQGELSAFFTTPHKAPLLAEDYMTLLS